MGHLVLFTIKNVLNLALLQDQVLHSLPAVHQTKVLPQQINIVNLSAMLSHPTLVFALAGDFKALAQLVWCRSWQLGKTATPAHTVSRALLVVHDLSSHFEEHVVIHLQMLAFIAVVSLQALLDGFTSLLVCLYQTHRSIGHRWTLVLQGDGSNALIEAE
jgi:hypothetical protein